ncbi:MAG: hypothetical protein IJW45_04190, partial [Oscillospiraceae bacterium]|nr:hypothetical protein [Oscillospiraceae bacterium]
IIPLGYLILVLLFVVSHQFNFTAKRHIGQPLSGPADVFFRGAFCNAPIAPLWGAGRLMAAVLNATLIDIPSAIVILRSQITGRFSDPPLQMVRSCCVG